MSDAEQSIQGQYAKGPIDIMKQMCFYIIFSLIITVPGLIAMGASVTHYPNHAPLRLGIDFTGGTMLQYGFFQEMDQETDLPKMRATLESAGISNPIIQLQQAEKGMSGIANVTTENITPEEAKKAEEAKQAESGKAQSVTELFKEEAAKAQQAPTKESQVKSIISVRTQDLTTEQTIAMQKALKNQFGDYMLLQKNRVGPTLAKELFIKAAWGLVLAYSIIVIYLAWRFQLDYAVTAITALVHDTLFMLGAFSLLGWFFHVEVDGMFVTAILTVVGFSVHDTIIVFDRIRENARVLYTKKLPFGEIVNISVNQTLARSINTSMTALLTLLALYFFGGESTRNFVLAMILGIIVGTYSSIFVASSLLTWWRTRQGASGSSAGSSNKTLTA